MKILIIFLLMLFSSVLLACSDYDEFGYTCHITMGRPYDVVVEECENLALSTGEPAHLTMFANLLQPTDGRDGDMKRAEKLYRQAIRQSYAPAMRELAEMILTSGYGNKKEGIELLEMAAKHGNSHAMLSLSVYIDLEMYGFREDNEKSAFWLKKAAESKNSSAQSILSDKYEEEKNYVESYAWLSISANSKSLKNYAKKMFEEKLSNEQKKIALEKVKEYQSKYLDSCLINTEIYQW